MTTTASKSGLRAKATATRTKAAQRTPLPSKDHAENVRLAKEAVAEAKRPKAARKTDELAAKRSAKAAAAKVEEAPSGKAERYAGELAALGWKPTITRTDGMHELVATRGAEALYLAWLNQAHVSGTSTYTISDRTVKVRNPAEAMRIGAQKPEQAKAAQERVSANKMFRRRATGPSVRNVPFDPETATDAEIIAALEAHQITWHNQYRVESESATVGTAKGIHVSRHARGHRIVSFIDPESGFRAFRLDMLENVGRKVNLERIRQEILNSLTKDAKARERKAA